MKVAVVCCVRQRGDGDRLFSSFPYLSEGLSFIEMVNAKSMGAGYNESLRFIHQNKFDIDVVIFTHTDVFVWASYQLLEDLVNQALSPKVGFVGVAGSTLMPSSGIWYDKTAGYQSGAVSHRSPNSNSEIMTYTSSFGPYGRVVALDGVFLAISLEKLKALGPWEEKSWHFYDADMSLRAHFAGLENWVVPFPIFHGSVGEMNEAYWTRQISFLKKWHKQLPVQLKGNEIKRY